MLFKFTVVLPFVKGVSEPFCPFLQQQGICVVFKSDMTLRSHLVQPKDTVNLAKQDSMFYRIPCECSKIYVGETGRPMQERMKKHERDILLACTQTSTICEHAIKNGHHPLWNKVKFIDRDSHWYTTRKLSTQDFTSITVTRTTELKFLKCGYQQSRNTAGDWYHSKPPRKQLGVRSLRKPELTGTMGIEIYQLHQIVMIQMVTHEQSTPLPDED